MIVTIQDGFDLEKILANGQCFRECKIRTGLFRFMSGKNVLYIQEWENAWKIYFNLDRDL